LDPDVVEECIASLFVGDKDELHRLFGRVEVSYCLVRLFVHNACVKPGFFMRVDNLPWALMAIVFHGASSHAGSIKISIE
jgi:hypothetical protein